MTQACIYLRLSRDDGDNVESNSIINQRSLLRDYARNHDFTILEEFVDDGISGLTFNRPGFNHMMAMVNDKIIDTIIVKDLSRFGRDYIETGKYLQRIFPAMGVRFISVNDHYDSLTADTNETHLVMPIKSLINDSYCRDISTKVRSTQKAKRQKGEYIGAFAPYGYLKDDKQRNHLVVDETIRPTIEKIFALKLDGYSSNAIAGFLNQVGVETPLQRKKACQEKIKGFYGHSYKWDTKMVNRILTNRVYTGTLEQGKQTKLNYKSQKSVAVNPADWVRVDDTHEAIISKSTFDLANNLLLRDVKHGKRLPDLFAGLLFCGDCQSQLLQRKLRYKEKETVQYICSTYNNGRGCSRHAIKQDMLLDLVATFIYQHLDWKSYLIKTLPDYLNKEQFLEVDFTSLLENRKKYEQLLQSLYLDLDDDLINEIEYQEFQRCYRQKLNQIEDTIVQKKELAQILYDKLQDKEKWLDQLSTIQNNQELNRITLVTLLDRIVIHENQELTLVFHDVAELELLQQFSHRETEVV
ncbi:TPA: recombinase family protein [Streptococcus suis]|nr:recombinase family protein [Streptococcus suis]HEM3722223.1 recombinase family protein [Streptococcus suis]